LICSCFIWLFSSFNFYLITFYLKSFPGSIYINSSCFAVADMLAFLASGIILNKVTIKQGLCFSYSLSLVASLVYQFMYIRADEEMIRKYAIPLIILFCRIGGSMSFNIGYISVARLFPTQFVATVFGIVNFVSHIITVGAPIVAELDKPIPMLVFCTNSFFAIFSCLRLKEL
jgi:hypothetical protein